MSAIVPFTFEDQAVRIADRDGEPWWVAADVCVALQIANSRDALGKLDADEKGVALTDTPGGPQEVAVVSQSGLFTLILRCRGAVKAGTLPHRFRKWVTAEVLPTILRTGGYGAPATDPMAVLADPAAMRGLLLSYSEKVLTLQAQNAELVPKAAALERIAGTSGSLGLRESAKILGVKEQALIRDLQARSIIYRRPGQRSWLGYADKEAAGLVEHKHSTIERPDGTEKAVAQVRLTSKLLTRLADQRATSEAEVVQ